MNIYQKLQEMRVALQGMNIKKTGENKFAGYKYYELGDFMPPINQLMKDYGVCGVVSYGATAATLTLFNAEKPEETVVFISPMAEATLKGAHPIQNLGAVETYQRRYLYMTAFEIVEADVLDATQGRENSAQERTDYSKGNNSFGYKKGVQRENKRSEQRPNLPADISDQLNTEIKAIKQLTGMTVQEIGAELELRAGIKIADVTTETAQQVLNTLQEIKEVQLPF